MNIQPLRKAIAERSVLKHPFYLRWNEGSLDLATLRRYAAQYYHHVAAFPRYLSAVHSQCDDLGVRQVLLENLVEEEQGSENHPELWLRFCEGLGLTREEVLTTPPWPATQALVESFFDLSWKTWSEGLAALYAYESQVPEVAKTKMEGLAKWYGVSDARSIQFFVTHLSADMWHRAAEEKILVERVPNERDASVLAAGKAAAGALWGFLDGMVAASA